MLKLCLLVVAILTGSTALAEEIRWSHSLDAALKAAKRDRKLVLLEIYAEWSEPCRRMHRDTHADPRIVRRAREFCSVKVDGDKEGRQIARRFHVDAFPETLVLDWRGEVVARIPGFRPPDQFLEDMMRAQRAYRDFPILAARAKRDKRDVEALAGLARIYALRGEAAAATSMLTQAEAADPMNSKGFLASATNAVGDLFQMSMRFEDAIPLFRKAAAFAKAPSQIAYARASLAACLYATGKNAEAIKELQAVMAMPDAPAKDKEDARKAIDEIRRPKS